MASPGNVHRLSTIHDLADELNVGPAVDTGTVEPEVQSTKRRKRPRLPCCRSSSSNLKASRPSVYDYLELLQWVKEDTEASSLTAEQRQILDCVGDIVYNSSNTALSAEVLHAFASYLDKVFFRSALMSRISISWTEEGALRSRGVNGHTKYRKSCVYHQQVHRAIIELDPTQNTGENDADWRLRVLTTLVLELCHAYIGIFVNREMFLVEECLSIIAIGGHGIAFQKLYQLIADVLYSEAGVFIHLDRSLWPKVRDNKRRTNELFATESAIEQPGLTNEEKVDLLVDDLKITREKAQTFQRLLFEGYTTLEAIVQLSRRVWDGAWILYIHRGHSEEDEEEEEKEIDD
jgi:hypothetical protein